MDYTQKQYTLDPITAAFIAPIGDLRSTLLAADASEPVVLTRFAPGSACLQSVQESSLVHVSLFRTGEQSHGVSLTVATTKEVFLLDELPSLVLRSILQSLKDVIVLYSPSAYRWVNWQAGYTQRTAGRKATWNGSSSWIGCQDGTMVSAARQIRVRSRLLGLHRARPQLLPSRTVGQSASFGYG